MGLYILQHVFPLSHLRNRLHPRVRLPNAAERSRHGQPVRGIHKIAATNVDGWGRCDAARAPAQAE